MWLRQLTRVSVAPAPGRDMARAALSIVPPLGVGMAVRAATGDAAALGAGVFAAIGALVGAIAPQAGPVHQKLRRTAAGVGAGALGLVVGHDATGGGWQSVVVVAAVAGLSALMSAVGANLSFGSLQLLVYVAVGSGLRSPLPLGLEIGIFFAGGAWSTLMSLAEAVADPVDPDRQAVGDVLEAVAVLLSRSGGPPSPEARLAVTAALNRAYDQLIHSRSGRAGRSRRLAALVAVLNGTAALGEGVVALYRAGERADPVDVAAIETLAAAVTSGRRLVGSAPPPRTDGSVPSRAVRDGMRAAWDVVCRPEDRLHAPVVVVDRTLGVRLRLLADRTIGTPQTWAFAVRLSLCMAIAQVVREHLSIERPYWVLLTVAIVLKPDFGSVFARAVQRAVGTVVGVVLGALVLVAVPHDGWMLVPMAVVAGLLPWAAASNYGLLAVSLTPLVLILLDLAGSGGAALMGARLVDTCIGAGIVLVFGYLLWPETWRSSLDDALGATVAALDDFLGVAFSSGPADRRRARRRAYRALTELQTQLQRQLAEPPPVSRRAAATWPALVQLERAADAVIEGAIAVDAGAPAPAPSDVTAVRQELRRLHQGPSGPATLDAATLGLVLGPVAGEVDAALRLVDGIGSRR